MAQTNYTPISLYYSTTASAVPTAANLVPGELAINNNDGKLYYEDSSGVVQLLASKATSSGTFGAISATSITNSGLTTGRVVYTTTGGLETSSANLLYSGTDLTVYGLTVGRGAGAQSQNTAVGNGALSVNSSGGYGVAVGYRALYGNTSANFNVGVGYSALYTTSSGTQNVALGNSAGYTNLTGSYNTFLGDSAGYYNTGSRNTLVGYNTGLSSGTNNDCIHLGNNLTSSSSSVATELVIGVSITGKGANTGFIGSTSGVYQGNNSTLWSITSDQRLKKNIVNNNIGLDKITAIQVRNFEYRLPEEITELPTHTVINKSGLQLGVIAQELQQILPECVKTESTGVMTVNADNLTWYMVNAIKELKAEVDSLKQKLGE